MTSVLLVAAAWMVLGFVLLIGGAALLVDGASRLARQLGVSELVVGLTIVAIGTSSPELAVTVTAALDGRPDMIVGNIVGSNIANIGLILGLSAVVGHMAIPEALLKRDFVWLAIGTLGVGLFAIDGSLDRWEGWLLMLGAVAFSYANYRLANADSRASAESRRSDPTPTRTSRVRSVAWIVLGLVGLAIGGDRLVLGASEAARLFGISEYLIGLTVVALGTSLPELATSLVGVRRGEGDLVLGGIVGSNIYNLFLILASGMILGALPLHDIVQTVQIPLMIGLTLALVPILRDGLHVRTRWGWVLLIAYAMATAAAVLLDPGNGGP